MLTENNLSLMTAERSEKHFDTTQDHPDQTNNNNNNNKKHQIHPIDVALFAGLLLLLMRVKMTMLMGVTMTDMIRTLSCIVTSPRPVLGLNRGVIVVMVARMMVMTMMMMMVVAMSVWIFGGHWNWGYRGCLVDTERHSLIHLTRTERVSRSLII